MDETTLTPLHPDHVKVLRITALLVCLPFVIGAGVLEMADLLPRGSFIVPILIVAAVIIIRIPMRRWQARGFSIAQERLRVVRGILFRSDTVVPFGRVQHIDVDQGPLERFYGLATLTVHTAGNHNSSVHLPGLAHEDAVAMREEIRAAIRRDTR